MYLENKMLPFHKKNLPVSEITNILYKVITENEKGNLDDYNGYKILNKEEKDLIIIFWIFEIIEIYKFLIPNKLNIIEAFIKNNYKIKDENEWLINIAITTDKLKKLKFFFDNDIKENVEIVRKNFPLNKNLNIGQITLILLRTKTIKDTINNMFKKLQKKYKIINNK